MIRRARDIPEPRHSHVNAHTADVVHIDRARIRDTRPAVYDQDRELRRGDIPVTITRTQAAALTGLLIEARQHRLRHDDPRIDEAIAWLGAHPAAMGCR